MDNQSLYNTVLNNRKKQVKIIEDRINKYNEMLKTLPQDSLKYERCVQEIKDNNNTLRKVNDALEFMRPNTNEDLQSRNKILNHFPEVVKNLFPDNYPIVFHGTNNIGTVREILKSGGLLTPDQRNASMTSFASAIDVTYKTNISVTCDFADAGPNSFMPYGAIFAFKPQDDEMERVFKTGDSTEVEQGVNGVNFVNEPNRLYGIITTPENYERVAKWCEQYSIDPSKVVTHNEFINKYKDLNNKLDVQKGSLER